MKDLQNNEQYLPGDLGSITDPEGQVRKIAAVEKADGCTIMYVSGPEYLRLNEIPKTEDVECEVVVEKPDDLKKVVFMKDGSVMDIEEWTAIPAPGTSKTEDAQFEVIENKQLPTPEE